MRFMTRGDKILVVLLVVASLFSFWLVKEINSKIDSRYISIQVNGEEYERLRFATSDEPEHYELETQFGRNLVEIGRDYFRVIEADCPDKLDVLQGAITRPGQVIVCLPNRMIIEIRGEAPDGPVIDDTVR